MNEAILCKYGEIVLKGLNKSWFEKMLLTDLRKRMKRYGEFSIRQAQSTAYIEPLDDDCDMDGAYAEAKKTFGLAAVSRAASAEKDIEDISRVAKEYIPQYLRPYRTFKVEGKRADKRFPMGSPEISARIGGDLLSVCPWIRVNVKNPDVIIKVEIREDKAFVHAGQERGAGGMPIGSNGRGLLLLSGGIDSPVAGYMMSRRGMGVEALHFESFPYTSERARQKVFDLAEILAGFTGKMKVNVVSLTHIQEELVKNCDEEYFTLLLRRFMMRIADAVARKVCCDSLITGESLGQVASQTMKAIVVTDPAATLPIFRPLIGMDKTEIIDISYKIGTFDTSIEPYEDCCTVFTPKHPKTRPEPAKVFEQESKIDVEALTKEALDSLYVHHIDVF